MKSVEVFFTELSSFCFISFCTTCTVILMSEMSIKDIILVVVSRLKQSEDSLEVFKAVLNLSISSKACKNYSNDKLLIEYSYKYVRDRTQFVIHKLKFFIRNNDFESFSTLADLFVDRYSRLESVRALNSLLTYVTEHGSVHFMQFYLSYFFDRGLHCGSILTFRREWLQTQPMALFPDFRPNTLIDALKLANGNHWEDKIILLVCRICTFCHIDANEHIEQVTATLKQKQIINYDFASYLMALYHNRTNLVGSCQSLLQAMTKEQEITMDENSIVKVTKELLQRPIEQQPWFFGNVKRLDIHEKYYKLRMRTRDVFLVTFYGSRLVYHQPAWKRQIFNNKSIKELPRYGLLNNGEVKDLNLYQFYLRLAAQDLEGMKQLQNTHGFNWQSILSREDRHPNTHICTNSQPQPLIEYLHVVDDIRQDIVDWLFELCPCRSIQFGWERDEISDQQLPIVRRIIQQGGRISSNLLLKYIAKVMPTSANDFKTLMTQWDDVERNPIWNFVFDQYRGLCRQRRVITDTKMTVLLAWKHADGESIGFRDLPRDLIRVIVGLIDEPPLVLSLAKSIDERFVHFYTNRCSVRSSSWFKDNTWAIEFFATSKLGWDVLLKVSKEGTELNYSIFRTNKKWIMLLAKYNARFALKFLKFMFKYEKDWIELAKLWSLIQPERTGDYERRRALSIEALKAQNKISLNLLVDFAGFIMPTKEEFQQAIKPKHNLTYEKMIQFVRENTMFKC